MGFILYIISLILSTLLLAFGVLFGLVKSFVQVQFITGLRKADAKFRKLAVGVDMYGNVACEELFNCTLIKNSNHKFGTHGQTISEVIGWNLYYGTLTTTGKALNAVLNLIQKDHALKAINKV